MHSVINDKSEVLIQWIRIVRNSVAGNIRCDYSDIERARGTGGNDDALNVIPCVGNAARG